MPPFHHGNVKDALPGAAAALIAEVGPQSFRLREVARRAGGCLLPRSFLYYSQDLHLYLAGTIDQTESKIKPFILMGKVIRAVGAQRAGATIRNR